MTLLELVQSCSARLDEAGVSFGHGTTCAFDEAALLVLWSLGLPLDDLDTVEQRLLTQAELQRARSLIDRRITERVPAAYLTGEAWLQGVPFHVDARSIVPRSLIAEVLADGLIDHWMGHEPARVLDLCTGNGSLAVLAAMAWPQAAVDASDLSDEALAVARLNLQRHSLDGRIRLLQGDALAPCPGPYDLVLCNPPYVNRASMAALPAEYRAEPALALDGGDDGMDFIGPLLRALPRVMAPKGWLVLEIGHERTHFERAFADLQPVWLPTALGEDQVLMLPAQALGAGVAR